ncbi:MAG: hypothetical protein LBC18_03670 [Opitutaceae bacterium]|jgi:hypothetical protein|nr:hypothetical protein [Opitutaceae bacterium]
MNQPDKLKIIISSPDSEIARVFQNLDRASRFLKRKQAKLSDVSLGQVDIFMQRDDGTSIQSSFRSREHALDFLTRMNHWNKCAIHS